MEVSYQGDAFTTDSLDLLIIGELLRKPETTFKEIAALAGVDQRTIARRISLMKALGVIRQSYEVSWEKIGVKASGYVGCATSVGAKPTTLLRDYIRSDPRVVESYETVGAHQYLLKILGSDISNLRDSVLRDLEPLTADISTSVVTLEIKRKDYFRFARYLRETRYPHTRGSSWGNDNPEVHEAI